MSSGPTNRTAALAGIFSSVSLTLTDSWTESAHLGSVAAYNLAALLRLGLLFFLPAFFLVIGQDTAALGRSGLLDAEKRAAYRIVVKRMLIWFASAGISGVVASTILNDVFID